MTDQPYTPTTEQIELLVLGQLKQSAEKRGLPVDVEADRADFRHWLAERDARIEAAAEQRGAIKALRDVEASLINWDVLRGDEQGTAEDHESIRIAAWIGRRADQIGGKICGLDGCESDEIAGHMQDGTLICYDCAREGEMEGGE